MPITRIALGTDPGPRDSLEDTAGAFQLAVHGPVRTEVLALLLFDGVGGNAYGEVASALALRQISSDLAATFAATCCQSHPGDLAPDNIMDVLAGGLDAANQAILRQIAEQPELNGMCTTAVCALVVSDMLYVAWAGDSRCYLYSEGGIERLTRDHSEVQKLVDAGLIDDRDARAHPLGHTINQFLGKPKDFAYDTEVRRLAPGDMILITSDGLTDVVPDSQLAQQLGACREGYSELPQLPCRLIDQALNAETGDNVTVLCCHYLPETEPLCRTLTGAYPVAAARAIRDLTKEITND